MKKEKIIQILLDNGGNLVYLTNMGNVFASVWEGQKHKHLLASGFQYETPVYVLKNITPNLQ